VNDPLAQQIFNALIAALEEAAEEDGITRQGKRAQRPVLTSQGRGSRSRNTKATHVDRRG
jgi:hypothetical protein